MHVGIIGHATWLPPSRLTAADLAAVAINNAQLYEKLRADKKQR